MTIQMNLYTRSLRKSLASHLRTHRATMGLIIATVFCFSTVQAEENAAPPGLAGDSSHRAQESHYLSDEVEITLEAGERLEYALDVKQGELLLYSWKTDKGNIYTDFHGAPEPADDYPENYWIRYEESEDAGAHGSLVASFSGHAAWYWVNKNDHPVTVRMELAGYFSDGKIVFRKIGK